MTTRVSPRLDGRMISISPLFTAKNGTTGSPASMRISPRATERTLPRAAMRSICAGVSVGNMSASCEALEIRNGFRSSATGLGADERRVDDVFGDEPDLQFVLPDDVAHQQVVGSIVARIGRAACHGSRFLDDDLVRMEKPRDL